MMYSMLSTYTSYNYSFPPYYYPNPYYHYFDPVVRTTIVYTYHLILKVHGVSLFQQYYLDHYS
jgi:hypothetical protein